IGHWVTNEVVARWNNHPGIVPLDVFMKAFNYLSATSLDGHENPHYRPFKQHVRYSREKDRTVERPLCAGMIIAEANGQWRRVGTTWLRDLNHYIYVHATPRPDEHRLWIKTAHFVDEKVVSLLKEKIRATFDSDVWQQNLAGLNDNYQKERKRILAQLA